MAAFWIPLFSGMTTCHRAAEKQSGKKLYNLKDYSLCRTHVYYCCIPTASSASPHMRLSIVGPFRGPITTNANTPELRMARLSQNRWAKAKSATSAYGVADFRCLSEKREYLLICSGSIWPGRTSLFHSCQVFWSAAPAMLLCRRYALLY